MKNVITLSVSLEKTYVDALARLAKKAGSRSAAIRQLLTEHEQLDRARDIEAAYREYFSDPAAAARERQVTDEMMSIASWPAEFYATGEPRGRTRRAARRRISG